MMSSRRSSRKTIGNNQGISLLEVLVAMMLVSIVVLGIAGFSTVAIKGSALSRKMTKVVTLAQDSLEEIRRVGYRPALSDERSQVEPYGSIPGEPLFERIVTTKPNTPAPGLQTITVKVAWDSDRHAISLATILAE
ncbi:MAG: prepilin-type N-terminal cleavage/methylation domain-containing protein [Nitrospirota bacterium]|nr:MAG: prepilin-type N-terminal cleavage/methylation domain-containing protein [Nitrospirota bacterium]